MKKCDIFRVIFAQNKDLDECPRSMFWALKIWKKMYSLKLDLSGFPHSGSAFLSTDNYRIISAENQSNWTFVNNMAGTP